MRLDTAEKRAAYRASMVPKGARLDQRSSSAGAAYLYETEPGISTIAPSTVFYVVAFRGSSGHPAFHYRYRKTEFREAKLEEFFKGVASHAEHMAAAKALRAGFVHSLKVGDVLLNSWGYDQTNADFYQVVELVGKQSVRIQPIGCESVPGSEGFMSENVKPVPGKFLKDSNPMLKRVGQGNNVKIHEWGSWARPFEGKSTYSSWYA